MRVGRVQQEVEGIDDRRRLVGGDRCAHPGTYVVGQPAGRQVAVDEPLRETVERREVGRADAPPCAAEHAHELGPGGGVVQHAQHAHEVGDDRLVEQPGHAEHMHGHAPRAQRRGEDAGIREGAAEQRPARTVAGGAPQPPLEPLGDAVGLVFDGLGPGDVEPTLCGERRRAQRGLGNPRVERPDERIRRVEHDARVAPARGQVVDTRRRLSREIAAEAREVRGARAPPAVDRLVGVADRHHRLVGEERREQSRLHDARVLVLVEQHGAIPLAVGGDDLGMLLADGERERDLVGELDVAALLLRLGVGVGEVEQRRQRVDDAERVDERGEVGALARRLDRQPPHLQEVARHGPHVATVGDVLGERTAEREHRARDAVERCIEFDEPGVGRRGDDRSRELPGGCLAEHGRVGLAPDEHRVLAVDRAREGVVGSDRRGLERIERDLGDALVDELCDALAHSLGELGGGLAREGQPEHLGHVDVAVREQPDDSVRHGLGLAAARARDDDRLAMGVGLDDGALLAGRRVEPEPRGDLECAERGASARTRLPNRSRGHRRYEVHAILPARESGTIAEFGGPLE